MSNREISAQAERVTDQHIDDCIVGEMYVNPTSTLTICILTLRNGFTVTGKSACVSSENYNKDIGEKIARKNAREKIWMLERYALRERQYNQAQREQHTVTTSGLPGMPEFTKTV